MTSGNDLTPTGAGQRRRDLRVSSPPISLRERDACVSKKALTARMWTLTF